jgi:hypothetical protein
MPFFARLRVLVALWQGRSVVLFFLNSALLSSPLGWDAPAVINNNQGRMKSHEKGELS